MTRNRQPNEAFAALVAESGCTLTLLASRINELAASRGISASFDHTSVGRWLHGERPRAATVELLASALTQALGRRLTPADLGMDSHKHRGDVGLDFALDLDESLGTIVELLGSDTRRLRLLSHAAFLPTAFATPALRWVTAPNASLLSRTGTRHVGSSDVEAIQQITTTFRNLDNQFGGGYARSTVVQYLHDEVAPMLTKGSHSDTTGRALYAASSELVLLAGWMAFDTEQHSAAQRYLIQALRLARAAGDEALGSEILNGMSIQSAYLGHAGVAVDMARAAQHSAHRAGSRTLMSESLAVEAHGHALLDDRRSCATALARAEQALEHADGEDVPAWLTYFDERYLAAKLGRALIDAGEAAQARDAAARALQMRGGFARGRAFNLALLAQAYAKTGDVEQACQIATLALNATRAMHSARAFHEIGAVRRALAPYAAAAVREFEARAAAALSAGPAVPALPAAR